MFEVESLHEYPLTGGRAVDVSTSTINAAGLTGSRLFVLYDTAVDPREAPNRVSQKQFPRLARVVSQVAFGNRLLYSVEGDELTGLVKFDYARGADTWVNEFGDLTPAVDAGDEVASQFAAYLGHDTVRLAFKSASWRHPEAVEAADRAVAPLHIVTTASVAALQERAGSAEFGAERFRPDIIIDTDEPFIENGWVGCTLNIGGVEIKILRPTKRCPVPGYDQTTGENKKDVPKLYRALDKADGKPVFGVYGYPQFNSRDYGLIKVGDPVRVQDASATIG